MFSRAFLLFFTAIRLLSSLNSNLFKNFRLEEKRMACNNGRENRKWLILKDDDVKILQEHGAGENIIEQIRGSLTIQA